MIEPHKNVKTYSMTSMYGMFTYIYHKNHLKVGQCRNIYHTMDGIGTIPPSTAISAPKFYLQAACDRFDIDTRSSETVHSLSNVEDAKCLAGGHSTSARCTAPPKINMSPKKDYFQRKLHLATIAF